MKVEIKLLPASYGDAILISKTGKEDVTNILIDSGLPGTYRTAIKPEIKRIIEEKAKIDLCIITHTDSDHIGGLLNFIKDKTVNWEKILEKVWFNYYDKKAYLDFSNKISYSEGIELRDFLLAKKKLNDEVIYFNKKERLFKEFKFIFLSPETNKLDKFLQKMKKKSDKIGASKNDYDKSIDELFVVEFNEKLSLENHSSLAFILEIEEKKVLFGGDSSANTIYNSLENMGYTIENKLKIDYFKLSHHGSMNNLNPKLLNIIECTNYIVTTDGSSHNNPSKTTFSWILKHPNRDDSKKMNFIFNYNNQTLNSIFTEGEMTKYNFECLYPNGGQDGYTIKLK